MEDKNSNNMLKKAVAEERLKAVPFFEDAPCYPVKELVRMWRLGRQLEAETDNKTCMAQLREFCMLRDSLQKKENAPQRIYLWSDGRMPVMTEYEDNSDCRYNHNPDFRPYLYEMLLPEGKEPKGAVVVCAGGDHGDCVLSEGYQTCLDFNEMGYHSFLLLNRTNRRPWTGQECGADVARAIRMIRASAGRYGIRENQVAFAGFSNGGLTGEACIRYYSGTQRTADHFPDYREDELDRYYGAPDAFLCIYGPRYKGAAFDYTNVVYPPVFFAVGREDSALDNLNAVLPDLLAHGVETEVHTFAGVPHGQGGITIVGEKTYPNFQLWLQLADVFLQDVFQRQRQK